jgi:hypothetical protein
MLFRRGASGKDQALGRDARRLLARLPRMLALPSNSHSTPSISAATASGCIEQGWVIFHQVEAAEDKAVFGRPASPRLGLRHRALRVRYPAVSGKAAIFR